MTALLIGLCVAVAVLMGGRRPRRVPGREAARVLLETDIGEQSAGVQGSRTKVLGAQEISATVDHSAGGSRQLRSFRRAVRRRILPRRRDPPGTDLVAVTAQLAGLAAAGVGPHRALAQVAAICADDPVGVALRQAATAAESGESIVPALVAVPGLREVAATWAVLEETGAPVAGALERLSLALADDLDAARAVEAGLAGPRATARILLVVPLLGIGLGYAMGADPIGVLFGGGVGFACLIVAALGTLAGAWWTRSLVAAARP